MSIPTERARELDAPAPTESGEPLGWVVVECTKQLHIASGGFLFTRERADAEAAAMQLCYPLLTFTVEPVGARPVSESAGEVERLREALLAAAPHVCSLLCPSIKKTGEEWTHGPECTAIRAALAGEQGREQ